MHGPGSTSFSEFLEIEAVSQIHPASLELNEFQISLTDIKNSAELNKIIDNKLPSKRPAFTRHEVKVAGEKYNLFMCDIIQCIKPLYGHPEHVQYLVLMAERHNADANKTIWLYHEMQTNQWWWSTKVFFFFFVGHSSN